METRMQLFAGVDAPALLLDCSAHDGQLVPPAH